MNLPRFSVNNPVLVHLVLVFIVILGVWTYTTLPRAKDPDVSFQAALVVTLDAGKSPDEIEESITQVIEDEFDQLTDINNIRSVSSEGISTIFIEYDESIRDIDPVVQDLRNVVNQVQNDLPDSAEIPLVFKLTTDVVPAVFVVLGGAMTEEQLKLHADALEDRIKLVRDVGKVELFGARDREVHVLVDPDRLNAHGLTFADVRRAVQQRHRNVSAGTLDVGRKEELIRVEGEFAGVREFEDLVLLSSSGGSTVRLGDVGRCELGYEDATAEAQLNGESALVLIVYRRKDGNVVRAVDGIKQLVEQYRRETRGAVQLTTVYDTAREIRSQLGMLVKNGLIGMALVLVLLFLFIGFRNALFAFVGIPTTFLLTFIFMKVSGTTINTISLFSLIIVLGMVVDDAIIILENVYRYVERGMAPKQAAIVGASEVALPVTAAVGTTISAFVPMMLVATIIGRYMSVIPKTVIAALAASLFEAFFMLPCHIAEFGRIPAHAAQRISRRHDFRSRLIGQIRRFYRRVGIVCLRWRYVTIAAALALLVGGGVMLGSGLIKVEMFGASDEHERVEIKVWRGVGTRLEETRQTLDRIERIVRDELGDEVNDVLQLAGWVQVQYQETQATHVGTVAVHLKPKSRDLEATVERFRGRVERIPGIEELLIEIPHEGPPMGADVDLQVMGPEFASLERIADAIKEELAAIPSVSEVRDNYLRGKDEVVIRFDEAKSSFLGVSVEAAAATVYAAFEGAIVSQYQYRDEKIDIRVRAIEGARRTLDNLENLKVPSTSGGLVPLKEVAALSVEPGTFRLHHYNRRRAINVTADVDKTASPVEIAKKLEPIAERIVAQHPGYSVKFGGESQETNEQMSELFRAFGFGVLLIYIILAVQFRSYVQPLMIMSIIPFAGFGVIFGLLVSLVVTGNAIFSIPVMVGVIALAGVVVNDSLVLVEFVNRSRRAGLGRWRSILQACAIRVRPIILTSVTTIGGLLPMAFGITGRSQVWGPLASAIAWGLLFSTVLTLVLIPCIYAMLDDIRLRVTKRFFSQSRPVHEVLPLDERE
ncbi:MAG: efflux RND transporter permease subunit [Verrucomicrobia bacterium]|nr:efflux RND transporter permease subunit [Verrucomicrobiota bacterium]